MWRLERVGDTQWDTRENSMSKEDRLLTIECKILRSTAGAVLIDCDGKEVWVPRSQIYSTDNDGRFDILEVTEWLAMKKGMI